MQPKLGALGCRSKSYTTHCNNTKRGSSNRVPSPSSRSTPLRLTKNSQDVWEQSEAEAKRAAEATKTAKATKNAKAAEAAEAAEAVKAVEAVKAAKAVGAGVIR